MDGFLGDVVPQLLEINLGVKSPSRIGNGAFGKPAEAGIAGLFLPVAVDENDTVIILLTERLRNIFIEQHVAVGNDRILHMAFPGLECFQKRIQFTGSSKILVIDIGQVGQIDGLFLIPSNHHDILDAHRIVGVNNVGEDWCALDVDHRFGLLFGEFPQFIAAGCGKHYGTGVLGAFGQIAVFSFL